jgi:AcrR family transcriptional regulator
MSLDSTPPESPQAGPRERILEASLKLFVEQGYFNTNVPDISKHSRCSVGSIYHHFLNKEEIASHLYKDGIQLFRNALTTAVSDDSSLEETVQNLVVSFLKFSENHKLLAQYIWLARHDEFLNHQLTSPTRVGFDPLGRKLTKTIKSAIREGKMPPLAADVIWNIIFGIPLSFVRDWLEGFTKRTPTEAAPVIASACIAALKGATPQK